MKRLFLTLLMLGTAAQAQQSAPTVVAVPPFTSPDTGTRGNEMLAVGWDATQLIASDLAQTAELSPLKPNRDDYYAFPEVTAPTFSKYRAAGAKALVMGFVQSRPDGRLTFGCYVYDVEKGRELARKGFVLTKSEWRRAAHKCSGVAYTALTGAPGIFDTRIAYVAETGTGENRVRRIAVMDSDGSNQRFVTNAGSVVLTPRIAPHGRELAYVNLSEGRPSVRIVDLSSTKERPLLPVDAISFAPRYSPDGSRIVFSMMNGANSDIYVVDAAGGTPRRLTTSPAIDTDPSFSPDGSQDRVRERPQRIAAALCDERRRQRAAPDQLRQRGLCRSRLEPGRTVDRVHPARPRKPADRRHQARRHRRSGAERRASRRWRELGGEQPRAPLPAQRALRPIEPVPRSAGRQPAAAGHHPAGRLRS